MLLSSQSFGCWALSLIDIHDKLTLGSHFSSPLTLQVSTSTVCLYSNKLGKKSFICQSLVPAVPAKWKDNKTAATAQDLELNKLLFKVIMDVFSDYL